MQAPLVHRRQSSLAVVEDGWQLKVRCGQLPSCAPITHPCTHCCPKRRGGVNGGGRGIDGGGRGHIPPLACTSYSPLIVGCREPCRTIEAGWAAYRSRWVAELGLHVRCNRARQPFLNHRVPSDPPTTINFSGPSFPFYYYSACSGTLCTGISIGHR
jgi:hypothetical protein